MQLPLSFPLRVAGAAFDDGPRATITDPWRGDAVGEIVLADHARAALAADAARDAFAVMRRQASFERKRVLRRVAEAVERDAEAFAELIAREAGKPISLARGEVKRAVATLELGAEEATRIGGEVLPLDLGEPAAGFVGGWRRVPVGPVLALAPFNFPLNLVCHKLAPALACGCPVVLKPPPQAPLTALRLADLIREAGAPKDAVQVVPCEVDVAESLVTSDRFELLTFTGSAKVGWHLAALAPKKRPVLELGGNAAVLVHEDADLAWAVGRTVTAAFAYAGQVCIKAQRLYVHAAVYDRVLAAVAEQAARLAPKDPLDPAALLGPMIDPAAAARVDAWVDEACATPGVRAVVRGARDGARLGPTVLAVEGDGAGLRVVDEEVFGPVLTVHRYATWEEGLRLAGASRYGLQAAVFTRDAARIRQAAEALEVGALVVNDATTFRVDAMPYGGVRDSGRGREGVRFAIEAMTEMRLLAVHI